jgi:hypothetical protein
VHDGEAARDMTAKPRGTQFASSEVEICGLVFPKVGKRTVRVAGGKPISWSTAQLTTFTLPP